jgi:SlyX protein
VPTQRRKPSAQRSPRAEQRIKEIEIKLCYQEDTVEKLNQMIIKQQEQIDRLERRLAELDEPAWPNPAPERTPGDEPPPHY